AASNLIYNSDYKMVEQAHEANRAISPQAGPSEVENQTPSDVNMSSTRRIGQQLAQIGDELNSRWSEKLPNQWPRHQRWQEYATVLNLRAINRQVPFQIVCCLMKMRIVGRLWWSKIMPTLNASWVVPQLHTQACQTAMKWIRWVLHFPERSGTKCFLVSAVLLAAAAAFVTWKISES
ncbi:hypothetical protein NFI96_030102, partial [Prochilodus magdalenae]